jgi:hypothetical protein
VDALLANEGLTRHRPAPARRLLSLLSAAVAVMATAIAPAPAAGAAARSADSFVDSIGVNTHTYYSDTVYYSEFDAVRRKLAELGVRHIRENLVPDRSDQYERLNQLAAAGIKSTLIMGDPSEGFDGLDELVGIVKSDLRGAVAAIEGPNEYDMWGGSNWLSELRPYQQRLYAAIKSDPQLASLPVVGPSIVQKRNQEALGDISGDLDYGNIHSYPDGYSPESNLDRHLESAANNSAGETVMATETGYHTAVGWGGEHNPTSEEAMAVYVPRMFLEYFRRGVARTFSYELLDEEGGSGEREDNFGLLRNDFSEKPAFAALRNTIEILEDPGPSFSPGSATYSLAGETEDVEHLLLQKRDGSYYLAIWRAVDVWEPESQTAEAGSSGSVTVTFGRSVAAGQLYRPTASAAPVGSLSGSGSSVALDIGPEVSILELDLGGKAAPGRIKAWVSRRTVPAGGRVTVKGRLPKQLAGRSTWVKIQQRQGRGWRTIGRARTRKSGVFRKRIRMPRKRAGRASRVRVVARVAKPSRALRVRIKRTKNS